MKYHTPPKSAKLTGFVKSIWVYESVPEQGYEKILPTTRGQFLVNLRGQKLSHRNANGALLTETGPLGLQGVLTEAVLIKKDQKTHVCGVQFEAGGLNAFTNMPATDFVNNIVNAEDVWGPSAVSLRASLRSEVDAERQCDQIEKHLLQHLVVRPSEDEQLQYFMNALSSGVDVTVIQKATQISQRKLHALFNRRIGVRPKLFARIERFSSGLDSILRKSPLGDVAYDQGYSDQAHLTREFRRFAASSPRSTRFVEDEPHHANSVPDEKFKTGIRD